MKTLIAVRHAKSNWDNPDIADHDRPLNKRGKNDAPQMAKRLKKKGIQVDLLLSSTALRAHTTAELFAEELKISKAAILLEKKLYLSSPEMIYKVITALPDEYATIAFFAHNPGITEFVNTLTQQPVEDMPTCAMYAVEVDTDQWRLFENADKKLLFFDFPKNE